MKNLLKITIIIGLIISIFHIFDVNAGIKGLEEAQGLETVTEASISVNHKDGSIASNINTIGLSILQKVKYVLSGIMLIFIVYAGAQMIMSMGTDDDDLSSSKRTMRYSLIGLVFINIPGTLYEAFVGTNKSVGGGIGNTWDSNIKNSIFIDTEKFATTLNDSIIGFIEIMMASIAIIVIILAGIQIITSRGREEKVTESKNKIVWSIIGLIFIGFIEAWQQFAFSGKISDGKTIFDTLANLALFLAGPVAIFFLTLAGYYYITSNGEEERVTKAKNIIVNVVIGTIIILCSYVFLNDLASLFK